MEKKGHIFSDYLVDLRVWGSEFSNDCNNVKKASIDSGVETGNDSNDSGVMQNDDNLQNSTMSNSRITPGSNSCRINPNSFIKSSPRILKNIDEADKETQFTFEDIDQPGSSLSADVTDNACGTEGSSSLSVNTMGPLVLYNRNDMPQEFRMMYSDLGGASPRFQCSSRKIVRGQSFRKHLRMRPYHSKFTDKDSSISEWPWSNFVGNISDKDSRGQKMCIAATTNNIELMKSLLDDGVSPNCSDARERTPLYLASHRGYTEIVSLLLQYGADVKRRDRIGRTPLHVATIQCNISTIILLLSAGADPLSNDDYGNNPLQLAENKLRLLQFSKGENMLSYRAKVNDVIYMLMDYLKNRQGFAQRVETLGVCSHSWPSNTNDKIQDEVRDLLSNINTLSLKS